MYKGENKIYQNQVEAIVTALILNLVKAVSLSKPTKADALKPPSPSNQQACQNPESVLPRSGAQQERRWRRRNLLAWPLYLVSADSGTNVSLL